MTCSNLSVRRRGALLNRLPVRNYRPHWRLGPLLALLVLISACGGGTGTPRTPTEPELEPAFPTVSFNQPVDLKAAATGELYVVERGGVVWRIDPAVSSPTPSVALDISGAVETTHPEEGLLGFALHPDFSGNGRMFAYYTPVGDLSRLSEFVAGVETVLLDIPQPAGNHNGGGLHFGPADGFLYLSLGDGGGRDDQFGNGQNTQTLLGAVLRLDVDNVPDGADYGIPPDNPFADTDSLDRDEIWAWGLRNPYRMSFERLGNGGQRLWLGDVGQDSFEEVNIIRSGGNYGWNETEGNECFNGRACTLSDFDLPVHAYGRGTGQSVIGGFVYRGQRRPGLRGRYLFTDFFTTRLFSMNTQSFAVQTLFTMPITPSAFGEDANGELYVLDYNGSGLWRLNAE